MIAVDIDRFWSKVERGDGCWLWRAGLTTNGYGKYWVADTTVVAHRYAYELLVGAIPAGAQLDHLCRNRRCVRPDHLEPVTSRENNLRGIGHAARNAAKSSCVNGHAFTPENTYVRPDGLGRRQCRACARLAQRRYAERAAAQR